MEFWCDRGEKRGVHLRYCFARLAFMLATALLRVAQKTWRVVFFSSKDLHRRGFCLELLSRTFDISEFRVRFPGLGRGTDSYRRALRLHRNVNGFVSANDIADVLTCRATDSHTQCQHLLREQKFDTIFRRIRML